MGGAGGAAGAAGQEERKGFVDFSAGAAQRGGGAAGGGAGAKGEAEEKQLNVGAPLLVADHEVFDLLQTRRRVLLAWLRDSDESDVDAVLTAMLAAATRAQGLPSPGWTLDMKRAARDRSVFVSRNEDLEIDLQTAELFFRRSHLEPVPNFIARSADFGTIFGREPQHCALVAAHDHRVWVRLVGKNYNLRRWVAPPEEQRPALINVPTPITPAPAPSHYTCFGCGEKIAAAAKGCAECKIEKPKLLFGARHRGVEYGRMFAESALTDGEMWVLDALEPVLNALYGGRRKMKFALFAPIHEWAADAPRATLLALDDSTWKEFRVERVRGVVNVFVLLEHGRRLFRSLVYSSNARFSLAYIPPDTRGRALPWPDAVRHAAGEARVQADWADSLVISREDTKEQIEETFVPARLLQGLLPAALLEHFFFWQSDRDDSLRGLPKDASNPQWHFKVHVRLVELETGWHAVITRTKLDPADLEAHARA
jgi:hypothetical protein